MVVARGDYYCIKYLATYMLVIHSLQGSSTYGGFFPALESSCLIIFRQGRPGNMPFLLILVEPIHSSSIQCNTVGPCFLRGILDVLFHHRMTDKLWRPLWPGVELDPH